MPLPAGLKRTPRERFPWNGGLSRWWDGEGIRFPQSAVVYGGCDRECSGVIQAWWVGGGVPDGGRLVTRACGVLRFDADSIMCDYGIGDGVRRFSWFGTLLIGGFKNRAFPSAIYRRQHRGCDDE